MSGRKPAVSDTGAHPRSPDRVPVSSTLNDAWSAQYTKSYEGPAASTPVPHSSTQVSRGSTPVSTRSAQIPPGPAQDPAPLTQPHPRSNIARNDLRASGYPKAAYYRDGAIHPLPPISEDTDAITPAPHQRTLYQQIEDRQRTRRNVAAIPSASTHRTLIQQIEDMNLTANGRLPNIAYPPERRENPYTLVTSPGVDTYLYHCPSDSHTQTWAMPARAILEHVFPRLLATRI